MRIHFNFDVSILKLIETTSANCLIWIEDSYYNFFYLQPFKKSGA